MKNILLFYLASSLYGLLKAEEKVIVDKRDFKLTVIILTMDRPNSLRRLMESIYNTDFENDRVPYPFRVAASKDKLAVISMVCCETWQVTKMHQFS